MTEQETVPLHARGLLARRLFLLCLFASAGGCGPSVIWHGRSPDRTQHVQLLERCGRQNLVIGEERGPDLDAISYQSLVFGPTGGRLAYLAREDDRWLVVVDQKRQPGRWDGVAEIVFSPAGDKLAYAAQSRDGEWRVVQDGVAGTVRLDSIFSGTLAFDDSGTHLMFAGQRGDCAVVVLDGQVGPCFNVVADLQFGSGTETLHWGYLAQRGDVVMPVIDGQLGTQWDSARSLELGGRARGGYAFFARRSSRWSTVIDGEPGPSWDALHTLELAADGQRWAYVAGDGATERVVERTSTGAAFDEVRAGSLIFGPASSGLAYVARSGDSIGIVRGGVMGRGFAEVSQPVFDPTGQRLLHTAVRHSGEAAIVLDDRVLPTDALAWAGEPVWGPEPAQFAVAVRTDETMAVLVHNSGAKIEVFPFDVVVEGSVAFDALSGRWGAVVGDVSSEEISITIDGRHHVPFDMEEMSASLLRHPMNPGDPRARSMLSRWVAAEVALQER